MTESLSTRASNHIDSWKSKLIDLTRRNRLLYYKPTKSCTLVISAPGVNVVFSRLVISGKSWKFWFPPDEIERSETELPLVPEVKKPENLLAKKKVQTNELVCKNKSYKNLELSLKSLSRRSQTDYQDRGVRILHVAFGMMHWNDAQNGIGGGAVISPILLCPVELKRETARDPYFLSMVEEEITLNPALSTKLQNDFDLTLPPLPGEWEESSLDEYLKAVNTLIEPLAWTVEESAVIGLFSFHKLVIHNDLTANASLVVDHPLVRQLIGEAEGGHDFSASEESIPIESELDTIQRPAETFQILDADSSQQVCIQTALRGHSFVLQGPPGTGKSQTIANLIAEFIAREKKVLFVSEKMAALEVVSKRLQEKGLGDFCLELHSHKSNKRKVVTELKRCLDENLTPTRLPTEADFYSLTQLRGRLNEYVLALHEIREPMGRNVYEVLGELASRHSFPFISLKPLEGSSASIVINTNTLTQSQVQELTKWMERLQALWSIHAEGDGFPWWGCSDNEFTLDSRVEWDALLKNLTLALERFNATARQCSEVLGLDAPLNLQNANRLSQIIRHLNCSPGIPESWVTDSNLKSLLQESQEYQKQSKQYWEYHEHLSLMYRPEFFELENGLAEKLQVAWENVQKLLSEENSSGVLLTERQELLMFLNNTKQMAVNSEADAIAIAAQLDVPAENMSLARCLDLAKLAQLSISEPKPELSWLNSIRLTKVRNLIEQLEPKCKEYNRRRATLLERYDSSFFELDLDTLIANFSSTIYSSVLHHFYPGFYKDKKAVLRTTRTNDFPKSIVKDLLEARELTRSEGRLNAKREQIEELLCDFYNGFDTDFNTIRQAIDTADGILKLGPQPLPAKMVEILFKRNDAHGFLRKTSQQIDDSIIAWKESLQDAKVLSLFERMPGLNKPFSQMDMSAIEEWSENLLNALSELYELIDTVSRHRKAQAGIELSALVLDLKEGESMRPILSRLEAEVTHLQEKFGGLFQGIQTQWQEVTDGLNWTLKLCELLQNSFVPSRVVRLAVEGTGQLNSDELDESAKQTDDLLRKLQAHFSLPMPNIVMGDEKEIDKLHLDNVEKSVRLLMSRLDDLQIWTDYKGLKAKFEESGLGSFLARLEADPPTPEQLVDIFYKSIYQDWINHIFEQDARLKSFRGRNQDNLIKEFRELDKKLVECAGDRIIERCNSMRPQSSFLSIQDSEVGTIRVEAAKERRHLPLRKLFERIPNLLPRLKPCLLMSPLSVSQFLNSEFSHFDLVIFDEASQIFTEDAICSIYRANQFVIAGDSKQLPPTNYFNHTNSDDEEVDEENEDDIPGDFQSLLDECGAKFSEYMLRWHYRSRHESLIDFSNHRFYGDRLVTFPASDHESSTLGVKFLHVPDGVYDRGGKSNNPREAEVVVDQIFEHFSNYPKKSLGVVAFSQAQMTTIEDEIERRKKLQPEMEAFFKEDRMEGFFVKNLENVQGDERDVIIFSIGYGYDSTHKEIPANFGPVSKSGGERRLNVAVTRAREKVLVVSSMKASDINLRNIKMPGGRHLYHYLDYAERGEVALKLEGLLSEGETENPFEDEVAAAIRSLGYAVVPQVGCSGYRIDLGVIDAAAPGHFLLGVECDGATYHSASTARDRDRLRQQVLENLGWQIHRIWSPDWVMKRDSEIARLSAAIQGAHERRFNVETVPQKVEVLQEKPQIKRTPFKIKSGENSLLPGTSYYKLHEFKSIDLQYDTHSQSFAEIIQTEGPIHIDLAVHRLTRAMGIYRSGHKIQSSFQEMVQSGEKQNLWIRKGEFLWSPNMTEPFVRVPNESVPDTKRDLDQIAPEEIEMAMILIIREVAGISQEALITETARLFGFKRVGDKIRLGLFDAFARLQTSETIVETNGIVSFVSTT